jgi:hypothetical protein
MPKTILILLLILFIFSCKQDNPTGVDQIDVLDRLQSLAGIEVSEISPLNGFPRQFEITITQPLDHNNPEGQMFRQRVFLSHTGLNAPVVFMPSGYSSSPLKVCELSKTLGANQIYAAHRFMAGAEPAVRDWKYLTIAQASADFHRVVEILQKVYPGPWVSYGASKNGQAALFHRRFYPDDVKGTVSLVAPLSQGTEDPRYDVFLGQVGSAACREKIRAFQRAALTMRQQIESELKNYIEQSEFRFTRMNATDILEFEILEFPFSFWQITKGDCSDIPDPDATAAELFDYIKNFGYLDLYSDEMMTYYEPVYYQAYTELGWYHLVDDHLTDLLLTVPSYVKMAPQNVVMTYDPAVLQDVRDWLQTWGNNIIYIYGENDPWTAGAIETTGSTNAVKIIQPGANHTVTVESLDERELVYSKLNLWMELK